MGHALEVLTGQATNPGAVDTALTANAGDSFTVRSAAQGSHISLVDAWAFTTTNLHFRVRSPRMHDQAQNMRFQPTASKANPLMPRFAGQRLYSQDTLTCEIQGGAAEVDMATLLVYYDDLPGVNSRLFDFADIKPHIANLTTVEVDLTSSATSCNYSPTVALNGSFDTLKRNVDYAILGYECPVAGGTLGIRGSDTGNLRVGGPLLDTTLFTRAWFVQLDADLTPPCVPVINAANVGAINVDCACQAASTAFRVGINLAELDTVLAGHNA